MVVLGGGLFLMSEVSLQANDSSSNGEFRFLGRVGCSKTTLPPPPFKRVSPQSFRSRTSLTSSPRWTP